MELKTSVRTLVPAMCVIALSSMIVFGGEVASVAASHSEAQPTYESPYNNGFYSTIIGNTTLKDFKVCNATDSGLCVPGFKSSMPIRTMLQPGQAPLVVLLLGCQGKIGDPVPKLWANWLHEAGNHVLVFNSSLSPEFIGAAGRGVAGNIVNEAECSRDIIGAFIKTPEMAGRITKLGIVGMSYGGIQALLIGQMIVDKKVDYKIDAIRSFSPPIDMMQSARLIDRWWREDRWNYTLPQMYFTVAKKKPIAPGAPIPFSDSLMRAGVAASFRLPFGEIVDVNDSEYDLKILPAADSNTAEIRSQYAATYGFSRFMQQCTFSYWKDKLGIGSFAQLNAPAKLTNVLPHQPECVEAYISIDDPLNTPEDLAKLKECTTCNHLTILNGGGHLGFVNDPWTKSKLLSLFNSK